MNQLAWRWLVDVDNGGVLHYSSCPLLLSIICRLCYGCPRDISSDIGGYAMMFVGSVCSQREHRKLQEALLVICVRFLQQNNNHVVFLDDLLDNAELGSGEALNIELQ